MVLLWLLHQNISFFLFVIKLQNWIFKKLMCFYKKLIFVTFLLGKENFETHWLFGILCLAIQFFGGNLLKQRVWNCGKRIIFLLQIESHHAFMYGSKFLISWSVYELTCHKLYFCGLNLAEKLVFFCERYYVIFICPTS